MTVQEFAAMCLAEFMAENPDDEKVEAFRAALDALADSVEDFG